MPVLKNTILSEVLNRLTVEIDNDMEIFTIKNKAWQQYWKGVGELKNFTPRARTNFTGSYNTVVVCWAPRRVPEIEMIAC